jgi:hypothetical protein
MNINIVTTISAVEDLLGSLLTLEETFINDKNGKIKNKSKKLIRKIDEESSKLRKEVEEII